MVPGCKARAIQFHGRPCRIHFSKALTSLQFLPWFDFKPVYPYFSCINHKIFSTIRVLKISIRYKETLSQNFINKQISFMRKDGEVMFLSHCLGDLRVKYTRFIYTWLETVWSISYEITEHFSSLLQLKIYYRGTCISNSALCRGVGHFEANC